MIDEAYTHLNEKGLICYGVTIPKCEIENALNMPFSEDWNYLGKFLDLKEIIESHGFQATTRNCQEGDLFILPFDVMIKKKDNEWKLLLKKQRKRERNLSNVDTGRLEKNQVGKLYHAIDKMILMTRSMKNSIKTILN